MLFWVEFLPSALRQIHAKRGSFWELWPIRAKRVSFLEGLRQLCAKDVTQKLSKEIRKCIDKIIEKHLIMQINHGNFILDQWSMLCD